jgi:hypothetical protein
MIHPYGTTQTITLATYSVTLSENNFESTAGNDSLAWLGYKRTNKPEDENDVDNISDMGATFVDGTIFPPRKEFEWALKELTLAQVRQLMAIADEAEETGVPAVLNDQRQWMQEATARRSRARVSAVTGIPNVAGQDTYWPRFRIFPKFSDADIRGNGKICGDPLSGTYRARMTATEYYPPLLPNTAADLA